MGMVPPRTILPLHKRSQAQVKEEHPQQEEWEQMKQRAKEQGLLHNDGTFAVPPPGGSVFAPSSEPGRPISIFTGDPPDGGQSIRALLVLMQAIEEQIQQNERPEWRIDQQLIGEEYR